MNESCHTYERVIFSRRRVDRESCHTCEWVMSCVWMSHGIYQNESCHIYGWFIFSRRRMNRESFHTCEWVMSYVWMSHVAEINESSQTTWTSVSHALWNTQNLGPNKNCRKRANRKKDPVPSLRHEWYNDDSWLNFNFFQHIFFCVTAYCIMLHHTAARCCTLQRAAARCSMLQHTATQTATLCNTLQHSATHCNTLQHTARN